MILYSSSRFTVTARTDTKADAEYLEMLARPPHTEPEMESYGPYTARTMWQLYCASDWTHMHLEQAYDIMADRDIPWKDKKKWTDRAQNYGSRRRSGLRT